LTKTRYLRFDRLHHPIALEDAEQLEPIIADIFAGWPYTEFFKQSDEAFVTIRPDGARGWLLSLADAPSVHKRWDDVNVICDLVAEMAWERLRSDPELFCLHAAAVDFGGCLVVIPNARRAGKSTLAVALARLGHTLHTDDFLPVQFDQRSLTFQGVANGILPRVRLPLPVDFSTAFRDWVTTNRGPSNAQYKYLLDSPVAQSGSTLPLGAVVVLDRLAEACEPSLEPISREEALASLITQNFARTGHSSKILNFSDRLTHNLPAFRLKYNNAETAAEFLSTHFALQELSIAVHTVQTQDNRQAPLDKMNRPCPWFDPSRQYVHTAGVTETKVGDDRFLADSTGVAIHRLNPGSVLIWQLLSAPIDLDEMVSVVGSIFEDVDPEIVLSDTHELMRSFVGAGLVSLATIKATDF
jgi:hypothetical protein